MDNREISVIPLVHPTMEIPYTKLHNSPEAAIPVGPNSSKVLCPSCRATVFTRVQKVSTTKTHNFALKLLCLLLCCPCCAIMPYCMDSCKAANHFCPHCDAFLGTYDH